MHIAFFNPQGNFDPEDRYWTEHPDFGGQLVYVKEVALELGRMGHDIDIVTRRVRDPEWEGFEGDIDGYPGEENVRIVRIPCGGDAFLRKEDLWPYLGTEWVPNFISLLEQEDRLPDVVTAHYGDGGLSGALLLEKMGIPFSFTGHSLGAQKMDKLGASQANLADLEARFHFSRRLAAERMSMQLAGRVITSTTQERVEQYGHRAYHGAIDPENDDRFSVVPPGVNLQVFKPEAMDGDEDIRNRIQMALVRDIHEDRRDLPLVVASSRLDDKKNHIDLVRAFSQSVQLRAAANLAIVVRGLDDPLHEFDELGEDEQAIMTGIIAHIDDEGLWGAVTGFPLNSQLELAAAYRVLADRGSVFALTARYEPFGLAPLEAMSCGLPAVVTKNGGPTESLIEGDREFGILIDPEDPNDIAEGLLRILRSKETWEEFRDAGRERVLTRYTWTRTAEGYAQVLGEISTDVGRIPNVEVPSYFTHPEERPSLEILSAMYFG